MPLPIPSPALPPRRSLRKRLSAAQAAALALAVTAGAAPAGAQTAAVTVPGLALQQLEPSPAGDALFGVPSPSSGGHLIPRAFVMFDYAHNPLQLQLSPTEHTPVVASQGFLRLDVSLALWERLLVSLDMPFAVMQKGQDPGTPGVDFHLPSSAALGDLRIGARARLLGADQGPVQLALGGYVFVPTGPAQSYSSEGAVRGAPQAIVGGQLRLPVPLVWSVNAGAMLRGSGNPHTATFGGGAAFVLAGERLRIGPELYGAVPLTNKPMLSASGALSDDNNKRRLSSIVNLELLLGARMRLLDKLEIGVAGGPGLSQAVGTPTFRLLALAGWAPAPARPQVVLPPADRDGDGIGDSIDACPNTPGVLSDDKTRNGCPKADRDGDGVLDISDACPMTAGPANLDHTKNGCPPDRDEDGIADANDACPAIKGAPNEDPKKNGCPNDRDADGILDLDDACPRLPGPKSADRTKNGCPEDIDGDGIKPPEDACPFERGERDPSPTQNGCPKFVRVINNEIVLLQPIRFVMYGRGRKDTLAPLPDEVIAEIKSVIEQHPEFKKIEIQGHADDAGDPEFNTRISQERAETVYWWLVEAGISKDMVTARGYGDQVPAADNHTQEGRQKNRRVQLIVIERQ